MDSENMFTPPARKDHNYPFTLNSQGQEKTRGEHEFAPDCPLHEALHKTV